MVTRRALIGGLLASLVLAGCASEKKSGCPEDTSSIGLIIPSGFGISIGQSGASAAFKAIREYFEQRPTATSEADKARAAELAADAAAKNTGQPMNEEQKRALRSQADQWVQTYTEKCKPG